MYIYYKDLKPYYNVIDIRDNYSYNISHFENAINIPMDELLYNYSKYLDKKKEYYIYCTSGYRSKRTCDILRIYGYNVINVVDGCGR